MFRRESPPFIFVFFILLIVLISVTTTEPLFGFLILAGLALVASAPFIAFVHPGYFHTTKKQAWKKFAASNGLSFDAGNFFRKSVITGTYRGYDLKMDTCLKAEILNLLSVLIKGPAKSDYSPYTRLRLSAETFPDVANLTEQNNIRAIIGKLKSKVTLKGEIVAKQGQLGLCYEQKGIEIDGYYLQLLLQTLSKMADAYNLLLALGGEIVPVLLQTLVFDAETLAPITMQLLYDLEQKTNELSHQTSNLLCPTCLRRYAIHKVQVPHQNTSINYWGCRICSQSRVSLKGRVLAVLDKKMLSEQVQKDGQLRVNWLIRRTLFDFDEVWIIDATDEDVERFVVQVGNDTDSARKSEYKQIRCQVVPICKLTQNTERILKRTFGKVELREVLS